jgi:hypothetical protein
MQRKNLPSGAWADIREVADVTERARRPIKRVQAKLAANGDFRAAVEAAEESTDDGSEMSVADQMAIAEGMGSAFDDLELMNDLLVAALVAGWSYEFPVSTDAVQDLPGRDLDALREAVSPLLSQLMPGFEPSPEASSPIVPSTV